MAKKQTFKDMLILNAITPTLREYPNYISVEDQVCDVLNFDEFKSENDIGWADVIFDQKNMPVCIRLDPANGKQIRDSVDQHDKQTKNDLLEFNKTASQLNELEREKRHGLQILDMVGDENEKFFMACISCIVRSKTLDNLDSDLAYFDSAVQASGMNYRDIKYNKLTGLLAASPLRVFDKDAYDQTARPFPASTIAHSLFNREVGLDDGVGITLGHDDRDGIVRLDIINRPASRHNSNIVIVGGSGSGKSTLAKLLLLKEYLLYGSRIIIIDPEGEFSALVRALGGDVVTVGQKSTAKISPLQPRAIISNSEDDKDGSGTDIDDGTYVLDELVLASTIPFAKSFLSLAFNISDELLPLLEVALEKAYNLYGINDKTTFGEYYEKELSYPVPEDLYNVLKQLADEDKLYGESYQRIALKIRSAAVGINKTLWNERSTFKIDSDIISFNTEGMDDDETTKIAWYYNIMTWIWSEARIAPKTGKPIRIVFDEAHNIINPRYPSIGTMLKSMVKRIRKRDGGTTVITQEVNDLLAPAVKLHGAAVLNNATYKFIGQAEGQNLKEIAELYGMEKETMARIKNASKGNFALFAGTTDRTWVKVDVEPWELEMFGKGGGR